MKNILGIFLFALSTLPMSAQSNEFTNIRESTNEVISDISKTGYKDATAATATVYEDGKSLVQTIYEDTKSLGPDLKEAVKSVAQALNTTADNLWNILVKQQLVWSICYAIMIIATIYGWYKFGKVFKKTTEQKTETGEVKAANVILCIALFIVSSLGSTYSFENMDRMFTGFFNPEFGAVRTIVEFISK